MKVLQDVTNSGLQSNRSQVRFYDCIESCFESANSSWICADSCLNEKNAFLLQDCILLCLKNAEVCATTARMLVRGEEYPYAETLRQLKMCMEIAQRTAEECYKFSSDYECCQISARCAEQCQRICSSCIDQLVIT